MSYSIQLNNVCKTFRKTIALNDVELNVPERVVFALLGENGAGKTTAIRSILGLEQPDSGSIRVLDMNPIKEGVEIRRQVGYVSDSPSLYDWMSVREIGWFASGFYGDDFKRNFEALASQFDLPLNRKIKQLSKGGRAKVALGLSMAHQPKLLILDEPTSGLDTMVRRKFLESMVDVASEGRTVFLSSHQIPEVERVAEYVAIMNEGKILVCDRLENLKQQLERWIITFDSSDLKLPEFEGTIMSHEGKGSRRQQLMVRDPDPNALWKLRDHPGVSDVEVHTPNLEEIFIVYMTSNAHESSISSSSNATQAARGQS